MKTSCLPIARKQSPFELCTGEIITNRGEELQLWEQHFKYVYPVENVVCESAMISMPSLLLTVMSIRQIHSNVSAESTSHFFTVTLEAVIKY